MLAYVPFGLLDQGRRRDRVNAPSSASAGWSRDTVVALGYEGLLETCQIMLL